MCLLQRAREECDQAKSNCGYCDRSVCVCCSVLVKSVTRPRIIVGIVTGVCVSVAAC